MISTSAVLLRRLTLFDDTLKNLRSGLDKGPIIYTSNLIENNNKGLKHHAKLKEQFPNEASLERFVCTYYSDYNRKQSARVHLGFNAAESDLLSMFDDPDR